MRSQSRTLSKRKIIFILLFLALLLFGTVSYRQLQHRRQNDEAPGAASGNEEKIDLSPPTEQDKQAVDANKQRIVEEQEKEDSTPPGQKKAVTPIITNSGYYSGNVEVSSFIPEIYEDAGTCTLNLKKEGTTLTRQNTAVKDATVTRCANFIVPGSELSGGTWAATVTYASPNAEGISASNNIEVE